MKITVAKDSGFCYGVKRAIALAESNAVDGQKIYTLGEIIHNKTVVEKLKVKGIVPIRDIEELASGDTVVIRSHGESECVFKHLLKKNIKIIDATCPFVSKIHKIVKSAHIAGRNVIIVGELTHPEVKGINGWCGGDALIVSGLENVERINCTNCVVVSQTTFLHDEFEKIAEKLQNATKSLEIYDTVCYNAKDRQAEAEILGQNCDVVLVIGDKLSSNTEKLVRASSKYCKDVYLIESADELKSIDFKNFKTLGITAGASTPPELITEVVTLMSDNNVIKKNMTMDDLLAGSDGDIQVRSGKKSIVTVIRADKSGIFVATGGKKDGFISREEACLNPDDYNPDDYKAGDSFKAVVIENKNKVSDYVTFSKKQIDLKEKENKEAEELINGGDFEAVIERAVERGLITKLGSYTIFIPSSQIKIGFEKDLEKYVGKKMRLRIIPSIPEKSKTGVNAENAETVKKELNKSRLVASQRVILEEERDAEKKSSEDSFWNEMQVGYIISGKVKRFTEFGAFVNVINRDCLVHISDIAWYRIKDPSEILELEKEYEFVILKADRATGKVSLGYKQLQKKPHEIAHEKYQVGSVIKGRVERLFPYGAFVSIEKGIDGLVPVSEVAHDYVKDITTALKVGDEVSAQIISFEGSKITLSIKAALPESTDSFMTESAETEMGEVLDGGETNKQSGSKSKRNADKTAGTKSKKEVSASELRQWTSDAGNATFGDLLGEVKIDFESEKKQKKKPTEKE